MSNVVDLATLRARRLAEQQAVADFDDEAFARDAEREEALPRDRLSGEAVAGLRRQLLEFADQPGDALLPVSVLYALNRELMFQRALLRTVLGAWQAYGRGAIKRAEFENDIAAVAEDVEADAALETITDPEVVLAGTVEHD